MDEDVWYRSLGPARRPSGRPDYSQIVPGLYVGEYPTPDDALWLRQDLEVTTVVNLQDEMDLAAKFLRLTALREAYERAGIIFHHVPVPDGDAARLIAELSRVSLLIAQGIAGGQVYLHCNAGMNRAPTVAIAYLHAHREMNLREAASLVKERRSCLPYVKALELHFAATVPERA